LVFLSSNLDRMIDPDLEKRVIQDGLQLRVRRIVSVSARDARDTKDSARPPEPDVTVSAHRGIDKVTWQIPPRGRERLPALTSKIGD
jgi:hypothetical protein